MRGYVNESNLLPFPGTFVFVRLMLFGFSLPISSLDEINQGLDERNERLVFSRIVANSCGRPGSDPLDHSGQYFLITPKLLPNLEGMDNPGISVLTVFNGTSPIRGWLQLQLAA